jgi:hypothetical protein
MTESPKRRGRPLGAIEHGTDRGYQAHMRRQNDPPCEECRKAHTLYVESRRGPKKPPKPIEHGTERGYAAHIRRKVDPCEKCKTAHSLYTNLKKHTRKQREGRQKTERNWQPIKHGTPAGYAAHRRRKEPACPACTKAHSAKTAENKRLRSIRGEPIASAGRGGPAKWASISVVTFAQMYWTASPEVQDALDNEVGRDRVDRWIKSAEKLEEAS